MGSTLPIEGGTLAYEAADAGPPIVFIAGLGGRGSYWEAQVQAFSPDFQTVPFDHRGVGTGTGTPPYSVEQWAGDTLQLMDHLKIDRVHLAVRSQVRAYTPSRAEVITFLYNAMHCCESFSALMLRETIVTDHAKGTALVLGPEDGESFWQPLPSTGYVINKFNPYNSPYDTFSTGLQVLEPGAHVRRHAHERSHELLFCYRGTGRADIEGKLHDICPETMILIGRGLQHKVTNTGTNQMRLLWLIAPPGLEDWFRAIGHPRRAGEPLPMPFDRPAHVEIIQAQQRFIRPDKD